MTDSRDDVGGSSIRNDNAIVSHAHGSACITTNVQNLNFTFPSIAPAIGGNGERERVTDPQGTASSAPHIDAVNFHLSLPPKPIVFHGREEFVDGAVHLLAQPESARFAILGAGGIGKTSVALAILYKVVVIAESYGPYRVFQSCEATFDADALVGKLAERFDIPACTPQLQSAVISKLGGIRRLILVLDNLETLWLFGGAPVPAVDELLGSLAQIPSVSLVITCRGIVLPQSVRWSNSSNASLEPFSLEAALETFQDRAARRLSPTDEGIAKELLLAVDMMPLAVTLLGQLAQRGATVYELLDDWNAEHCALLQTHEVGRINNVEVSVELSIKRMQASDSSQESLQLVSLCAMLPDGLRPDVFEKLRPQFKNIRRARERVSAYALANLGSDRVLKALSPVRHFILAHYPAQPMHLDAIHLVYFDIADGLPIEVDEQFKERAAAAAPEMGNLSSLLHSLVHRPSQRIVNAVIRFTDFRSWQQPTTALAKALLPHVDGHKRWCADCLHAIGQAQYNLNEYRLGMSSLITAAQLYLEVKDPASAAWCKRRCGDIYRLLGEYDSAVVLLEDARTVYVGLDDYLGEANCRLYLAHILAIRRDYPTAMEHLKAAHQTFRSANRPFEAAQCSELLGSVYTYQGNLNLATSELEASRSTFIALGESVHILQSTRSLGVAFCKRGDFAQAERLLCEAENISTNIGGRQALAECDWEFGCLRADQGRWNEAIVCFESAKQRYEVLDLQEDVNRCVQWILCLRQKIGTRVSTPFV